MNEPVDILKTNEVLAEKFRRIEESLPSCRSIQELFENLLARIEEEFRIPFVWISLLNDDIVVDLIKAFKSSHILADRVNVINRNAFMELVAESTMPRLINDNLKPCYKLLPRSKKYFIKSLAITPITLKNEIIGSINYGDFSSLRYQPEMDTTLLERLAFNMSERLSVIIAGGNEACR